MDNWDDLTEDCEVEFTNGETRTIYVRRVVITTEGNPVWMEDIQGWTYTWNTILRVRKVIGTRMDPEMKYDRAVLVEVLLSHWATAVSGCSCGGVPLGHSWPEHIADMYEKSMNEQFTGFTTEKDLPTGDLREPPTYINVNVNPNMSLEEFEDLKKDLRKRFPESRWRMSSIKLELIEEPNDPSLV